MQLETIEQMAQKPEVIAATATLSLAEPVTNTVTGQKIVQSIIETHWYDPYWDPIWNALPWMQLATVLGVLGFAYTGFVVAKNYLKRKYNEYHLQKKLK